MADLKITELTALTTPANADLFVIVDDVAGTATTKKITLANSLKGITIAGALGGTTWTGTGKISTVVTTEQFRLGYDATNYLTVTIAADGHATIATEDPDGAEADINLNPDGNVGIKTAAPGTALEVTGAGTFSTGVVTGAATIGLTIGNSPTGISFTNVGATGEHMIDCVDAYLGSFIETGTYQSSVDGGITLSDSNVRPVSFLFDDSGSALTGNNRAVLSRVYLAESQGAGGTIVALQGQLKIADDKDFSAGRFCAIDGYMEFGGTTDIATGTYVSAMNARVDVAASETVTIDAGGILCGIHVHTTGTGTLTSTGSSYGIYINDQGTVDDWKIGLGIANSTTGISIGAATTGLVITGATTTGISITGASSTAQLSLAHTMAAYNDQCILVVSSSTATDGSSQAPIKSTHTMTGVGCTGGRAEFNLVVNPTGAAGGWTNALKANCSFGGNCTGGTGLHTALTAEIGCPDTTVSGGSFAGFDIQLGLPSSFVPQAKGLHYFTMNSYTTAATMDTYGSLFGLYGVSAGTDKLFCTDPTDDTGGKVNATLRIDVAGTWYWIPLWSTKDGN